MTQRWFVIAVFAACAPEPEPVAVPPTPSQRHAQTCAEALGPIPAVDCLLEAVEVPITVDGVEVSSDPERCDRPSLLERSCATGSRVGRKPGERPEVTFVFICRDLEPGGVRFEDIAMIGYDAASGATCFFQSLPDTTVTALPSPLDDTEEHWLGDAETAGGACGVCHLPDPFLHSPWIDQVRDPDDPSQPLVPNNPGWSPYFVAGGPEFDRWSLQYFDLPDNACAACHPIARASSFLDAVRPTGPLTATAAEWPHNPWMPPNFEGTQEEWREMYQEDVQEIERCFALGFRDPDACNPTRLPR